MTLSTRPGRKDRAVAYLRSAALISISAGCAYIVASVLHSLFVLSRIEAIGLSVPLRIWLKVIIHDVYAMAFDALFYSYALTIQIGFLIAIPAALLVRRRLPIPPSLIFAAAGATAIATILFVSSSQFHGFNLLAGARTTAGYVAQLAAGAFGGALASFWLSPRALRSGNER